MDNLSNGLNTSALSDPKTAVMNQVRQEANIAQAKQLIEKVNERCFEKCVPKPGTSLSNGETTCFTQCMEKYMAAWNTVSRQYVARIQQETNQGPRGGGMF